MLNDQQVYTMAEKIADLVKSQATKSDPTGLMCVLIGDLDLIKRFLMSNASDVRKDISDQLIGTYELNSCEIDDHDDFCAQMDKILTFWAN